MASPTINPHALTGNLYSYFAISYHVALCERISAFLTPVQFDQMDLYHKYFLDGLRGFVFVFYFFFFSGQQENKETENVDMKPGAISREPRLFPGHAPSTVLIKEAHRPSTQMVPNPAAA